MDGIFEVHNTAPAIMTFPNVCRQDLLLFMHSTGAFLALLTRGWHALHKAKDHISSSKQDGMDGIFETLISCVMHIVPERIRHACIRKP